MYYIHVNKIYRYLYMSLGYDYCLKMVVVGEASSGKTTMVNRLCGNDISNGYEPTIGVEFNSNVIRYKDYMIKIQYWDTAGDKCFAPIIKNYYKNIVGLYLVIDLCCRNSIRTLTYWFNEIFNNKSEEDIKIIVIGNKCKSKNRVITEGKVLEYLKYKKNIDYIEISAINNENIDKINDTMLDYIFENYDIENHRGIRSSKKEILKLKDISQEKNERICCGIC